MTHNDPRLTPILEQAARLFRERVGASLVTARDMLDLRARAAAKAFERDALLDARHKLIAGESVVLDSFMRTLRGEMNRLVEAPVAENTTYRFDSDSAWQGLTLVDDSQVERDIAVGRLTQKLAGGAETELRDLTACMAALLRNGRSDVARHPLRADVPALAFVDGLYAGIDDAAARAAVLREYSGLFVRDVTATYGAILSDIKARGVRPLAPSALRSVDRSSAAAATTGSKAALAPTTDAAVPDAVASCFMPDSPLLFSPATGFAVLPPMTRPTPGTGPSTAMPGNGAGLASTIAWPPMSSPAQAARSPGKGTTGAVAGIPGGTGTANIGAVVGDDLTVMLRQLAGAVAQVAAGGGVWGVGGGGGAPE
jgi:hypothetical protein